jgi:hypothetical protein
MLAITEMFVFVVEDEDRGEELLGVRRHGRWVPLVATDRQRTAEMIPVAEQADRPYRILRFSQREDITEKLPKRSHKRGAVSAVSVALAADEDGDEAIVTSDAEHLPLVCVFPSGLRAMIRAAEATGQAFRMIRFCGREDLTERFVPSIRSMESPGAAVPAPGDPSSSPHP